MLNLIAPYNPTGYGNVGKNLLVSLYEEVCSNLHYENIGGFDGPPPLFLSLVKPVLKDSPDPTFFCWHQHAVDRILEQRAIKSLYTFFEVDRLPEYQVSSLNRLDHIFQPSQWGKEVLERSGVTVPISVLRPGIDRAIFNEAVEPTQIDGVSDNDFVIFVCGKWEVRKGYDILLDVFHRAFRSDDNVKLVINATNPVCVPGKFDGNDISRGWERFYEASPLGEASKIVIIKRRLDTQEELAKIMSRADMGCALSRAEGWNLEAVEMLSMGKHVILSDVTAHKEFGDETGATLAPYTDKEFALERPFFDGSALWDSPSKSDKIYIGELLRAGYNTWSSNGRLPVNDFGIKFAEQNTWKHTAKKILRHFYPI